MRHRKHSVKLGRTSSHRRCMFANMLKSLIHLERLETTPEKAKELSRYADQMITLAKKGDLSARRRAVSALMVRYNSLTPKESRQARAGNLAAYNTDRRVVRKLFEELGPRFTDRQGGYTRVVRLGLRRVGDGAEKALIEFVSG